MSHTNQQRCVFDLLTGMDSQGHHQVGRISGINGIGSDDLSGEPHLIFGHFGKGLKIVVKVSHISLFQAITGTGRGPPHAHPFSR